MSNITEIISKLTKVEHETIIYGKCGLSRNKDEYASDCICSGTYDTLIDKGLAYARNHWPNGIVLTELGYTVKQILING